MATKFTANYFTVLNKNGQNNLYRTDDVDFNELTFSFINRSQAAITFKGGENPSSLEFSMPFLRDGDIDPVKDFKFDNIDGWEPALLLNKKWAVWKFVCKNDIELLPGKSFSFVIKKILCKTYDGGYFFVKTIAVPGYADLEPALGKGLTVIAPESSKLSLPLGVSYTDLVYPINTQTDRPHAKVSLLKDAQYESATLPVYLTYDPVSQIKNGFKLLFTTDTDIEIFKPGGEIKEASITIMFLFGTYPHQITTTDLGNSIEINANQVGWKLRRNADSPSWKWIPDPQTIREFTSFSFNIRRLVTDMEAVEGISLMYVQVNNFGKFADHVFRFQLEKRTAKPPLVSLKRSKETITIGDDLSLSWNSMLANKLEIAYRTRENQRVVLSTHPKTGEQQIELTQNDFQTLKIRPTSVITTFEATAYAADGSTATATVTVNVLQKPAEIKSFIATPAITEHGVKTKVMLSWDVSDASQLKLIKGGVEIDVSKTTSKEIEIDSPNEYKLVARSYSDVLQDVSKKLKLYTSKVQNSVPLEFKGDQIGDLPKTLICTNEQWGNMYLFAHCGRDHMYQIDLKSLQVLETFNTKRGQFALHPEMYALAVYYNGRQGQNIYLHSYGGPQRYYIEGNYDYPTNMKFSPDGEKLFISYVESDGTDKPDPNVVPQMATSYLFVKQQVRMNKINLKYRVGIGPTTIAFDSLSSSVYYSSYGEEKIYKAKYNDGDRLAFSESKILQDKTVLITESTTVGKVFVTSERSSRIPMYANEFAFMPDIFEAGDYPIDILLSPDGQILYVACIKDNKVVAVDTINKSKKTVYNVDSPSCLALSKNGEVLFVGNHRGRSLTMINLKNGNISPPISTGPQAGNPMVLTLLEDKEKFSVYITKESFSARTKWTQGEVITPNTSLNLSVITVYQPS